MRKLFILLLAACLLSTAPAFAAEAEQAGSVHDTGLNTPHRINQLTGDIWLAASEETKLAVLFGMELAISADYASKAFKPGKRVKPAPDGTLPALDESLLSPFEKAWYHAFRDTTLPAVSARIDEWYKANPDHLGRPVFHVLWIEIMKQPAPGPRGSRPGKN
ncbi:MAG: hypothetical protein Q4F72_07110 [Desulfovibrionaceae bacterium]|nr:hypothetical protein [Desulfovibrionaceae bacterium]